MKSVNIDQALSLKIFSLLIRGPGQVYPKEM